LTLQLATMALLAFAALSPAAILLYSPVESTGGTPADVRVTLDDSGDVITGTVTVLSSATDPVADIRAVYFNLVNLGGLTPASIAAAISGAEVTDTAVDTQGFEFGGGANINPLGPFTIGIEIGTAGIGTDDVLTTTFVINNADLALTNFAEAGVRLQSIGLADSNREGSGKFLDDGGLIIPDDSTDIPEPSTYALISSALAGLFLRHWFRSA